MESVTCPQCDLKHLSTAVTCVRCGAVMNAPVDINTSWFDSGATVPADAEPHAAHFEKESEHPATYDHYAFSVTPHHSHVRRPKKKAGAVWAIILGSAGMPLLWVLLGLYVNWFYATQLGHAELIFGVIVSLVLVISGLALGIWAFRNAVIDPKTYAPRKMAVPGIIIGGAGLFLFPLVSAISIPAFLESRRAANEEAALLKIKRVAIAQQTYRKSVGDGNCGDLEVMPGLTLLDLDTARPESNGYQFFIKNLPEGGCEIHGVPKSSSEGDHSFYYSTIDNQLRSGLNQGKPAGPRDPLIGGTTQRTQTAQNPPGR